MERNERSSARRWTGSTGKRQKRTAEKTGNLKPSDLKLGDSVRVLSLNLKGTVSSKPDNKGFLFVQMGIMRSKVSHLRSGSDRRAGDYRTVIAKTGTGKLKLSKSATISTEINLLGKTVDEAIAELDKYLDDAYLGASSQRAHRARQGEPVRSGKASTIISAA